jgi:hypothetical protein
VSDLFLALDANGSGDLTGREAQKLKHLLKDAAAAMGRATGSGGGDTCPVVPSRVASLEDVEALLAALHGVDLVTADLPLQYVCLDTEPRSAPSLRASPTSPPSLSSPEAGARGGEGPLCAPLAVASVQRVSLGILPWAAYPHCVWEHGGGGGGGGGGVPAVWVWAYALSVVACLVGPCARRSRGLRRVALEILAEETEAALQDGESSGLLCQTQRGCGNCTVVSICQNTRTLLGK